MSLNKTSLSNNNPIVDKLFLNKKIFSIVKVRNKKKWTKEEDSKLIKLAEKNKEKHWKEIAKNFQNKNPLQCFSRYKRIKPGIIKGTWSKEEDERILSLVKIYEKSWSKIAKIIKSRNGKQIRDRFINVLDPEVKKGKFSYKEDKKIRELYLQHGPKWATISRGLPSRTPDMIKNRFHSSIKKNLFDPNYFTKFENKKKSGNNNNDINKTNIYPKVEYFQNNNHKENPQNINQLNQFDEKNFFIQLNYNNLNNLNDFPEIMNKENRTISNFNNFPEYQNKQNLNCVNIDYFQSQVGQNPFNNSNEYLKNIVTNNLNFRNQNFFRQINKKNSDILKQYEFDSNRTLSISEELSPEKKESFSENKNDENFDDILENCEQEENIQVENNICELITNLSNFSVEKKIEKENLLINLNSKDNLELNKDFVKKKNLNKEEEFSIESILINKYFDISDNENNNSNQSFENINSNLFPDKNILVKNKENNLKNFIKNDQEFNESYINNTNEKNFIFLKKKNILTTSPNRDDEINKLCDNTNLVSFQNNSTASYILSLEENENSLKENNKKNLRINSDKTSKIKSEENFVLEDFFIS